MAEGTEPAIVTVIRLSASADLKIWHAPSTLWATTRRALHEELLPRYVGSGLRLVRGP